MPAGSTPSDASTSNPPGISPSPQALSIGESRGSATMTESPCARAYKAAARPPGPPPTTSMSASNPGIRIPQRGVLHPDPHGQQPRVGHGEAQRRQPRGVYQWKCDALDHHGHVVGMVQKAV